MQTQAATTEIEIHDGAVIDGEVVSVTEHPGPAYPRTVFAECPIDGVELDVYDDGTVQLDASMLADALKTETLELTEDELIALITCFSGALYALRATRA